MKQGRIDIIFLLSLILFLPSCRQHSGAQMEVVSLKCRGLEDPIGIDEAVFSWKIRTTKKDIVQSAWEIEVSTSLNDLERGRSVWNSGKIYSDCQLGIRPEGFFAETGTRYWWRVRVWDGYDNVTAWSKPGTFQIGLSSDEWQSKWITSPAWGKGGSMPCFRKEFEIGEKSSKLREAYVYFCGLGYGDLYLNGELIDPTRLLDPAQTNYEQYALYTTFDVTDRLVAGKNCLGVILGEGMYSQGQVWGGSMKYGDPLFRLQLEMRYEDGTREFILSDESWKWHDSPVQSCNIYAGEVYDATKEIPGWSEAGTELTGWHEVVEAVGVIPNELRPQVVEPIRMKEKIAAIKKWKDPSGNWIFDFGVNVAGIPQISIEQPKGTRLKMRLAELVHPDGSIDHSTTGTFATGVVQTDEYICAGNGCEVWNPRFTYHGCRYLELSGTVSEPSLDAIKLVVVHTDVAPIGHFECSDSLINRLHDMAVRTMLSNTHGLPTDCPHRERCGWLGDAHAVAPFENCNFNMDNFWMKYMEDIYSTSLASEKNTLFHQFYNRLFYFTEKVSGLPYMIAPGKRLCGVASPDWGTAVVQLPWYSYLYYGNDEPLRKYYKEMKLWVDHIEGLSLQDSLPIKHIVPFGLGDWCPPEGKLDCPVSLTSTIFHYIDASIVANVADLFGYERDASHYSQLKEQIKNAFIERFYDKTQKTFGSQTANAMALETGLVPEGDEQAVSNAIVANMQDKYANFMHVGIFGLKYIGQALSRHGNAEAAWNMFTKVGENSFAYMWSDADATTLWEVLPINEASKKRCLDGNASLNHPMQGSYDAWFYEDIAGIRPDASGPGFKVVRLEPTMTAFLQWAKASMETPYGTTKSYWNRNEDLLEWEISLPPNTSGIVALPSECLVKVDGNPLDEAIFPIIETKKGLSFYKFPSGDYEITISEN